MPAEIIRKIRVACGIALVVFVSGCATTGAGDPRDPFEGFNRGVYSFNQAVDDALFNHVSKLYQVITPELVDKGITNFFSNLNDIAVVVNDFLQLKVNQALSDATRFIFNSTIGLAGFFDVSTHAGLPKHDEDFGQTLAHWGVGSGPYLVIPLFGPSTVRDVTGNAVDRGILNPVFYLDDTELKAGLLTLNYVDFKADLLSAKKLVGEAALDEYEFVKNAYFEKRAHQISVGATTDFSEP
ncbi:MAG: VacJ family lipoprotein [Gammaproteobacteria bacterium]|nr:VacJ family lipoprotein [Gammaproteobacteria bacterium]